MKATFTSSTPFPPIPPCDTISRRLNFLIFPSLLLLLSTAILCYNSFSPWRQDINMVYPNSKPSQTENSTGLGNQCDLFSGDWVPHPEGPYYTNETNCEIDIRQNCMKNGRPDTEFMNWRWKPEQCELPLFDAIQFLELVRGKTMAFVGDSLSRNQLQSLLCLLATAVDSIQASHEPFAKSRVWFYPEYNFTLAFHWSFHLVKSEDADLKLDPPSMNVYLEEVDEYWPPLIENSDFVIISSGQWFLRALMYHDKKGRLIGCYLCKNENITDLGVHYGYRMAFRTSFRAIMNLKKFKGITFLRTFTPSHFEGGMWNEGGKCSRTRPVAKHEMQLGDYFAELHSTQVEELRAAETEGWKLRGLKFRVLEVTEMMRLRPDGHPSKYGRPGGVNVTTLDCAHWCLPGPIDAWNELLLQMLKMELKIRGSR
ncbi:OLC1v1009930C1 [Oldenlandia corymbosa var. corymbosa]|uniref:OLC1v1009930C1 n=1 Tax=Oldenlandia corymbosa var. corymbosa TaxID=529605 RepID=A0AAV1DSI5_OLDCO|nr:OLC1v1009930C1 [Oldenlandia corymbosa var. corymbosa]